MARISVHPAAVLLIAAAGMLAAATGGPDFGRYRAWMFALVNADLFVIGSNVGSPLGLPLTTWSHGPGALFALPMVLLGPVPGAVDAPLVVGWGSALVFWWAFARVLSWAARSDRALVAFGAAAAFIGTHAGFYTRAHASESLALAALAVLVAMSVDPDHRPVRGAWVIGCAAGLLLVTRVYYMVYALPALLAITARIISGRSRPATAASVAAPRARLLAALALGLPLLAAATQQALVNRWMTGTVLGSTYVFGDAAYRSMDWWAPQLGAVLLHPWHGLLVYHPLYALGFMALVVCAWRAPAPHERLFWAGGVVAILVNLWVQGAWHVWWMGTGTFGMRGMAAAAVFAVPGLVRLIAIGQEHRARTAALPAGRAPTGVLQAGRAPSPTVRTAQVPSVAATAFGVSWGNAARTGAPVLAATACCLWSLPLLALGNTQLYTWAGVMSAQRRGLLLLAGDAWLQGLAVAALLVIGTCVWAARHLGDGFRVGVVEGVTAVLCTLGLGYVLASARDPLLTGTGTALLFPAVMLLVAVGAAFLLWTVALDRVTGRAGTLGAGPLGRDPARRLVGFVTAGVFVVATLLFARLAIDTETRLAAGRIPERAFHYIATYQVQTAINSLREYERVPGFEARKRALRRFLGAQRAQLRR